MQLQQALYELNTGTWSPMEPEFGKDSILYMMEEIGETIAILKKKGCEAVTTDKAVRAAFLEEMADILMYYHDILLRFHVTPVEISESYMKKHIRNTGRDYTKEYEEMYHDGEG